jgi:hypothetical protein
MQVQMKLLQFCLGTRLFGPEALPHAFPRREFKLGIGYHERGICSSHCCTNASESSGFP